MPFTNITNISRFVILIAASAVGACSHTSHSQRERGSPPPAFAVNYGEPIATGRFASDEVKESSGLAVSLCNSGTLWTLNDSGGGSLIHAFAEDGRRLGTWRVAGAENKDWEAMSTRREADGTCRLYIGETGNNKYERSEASVYRITEPAVTPAAARSTAAEPLTTGPAERIAFRYPEGNFDSEAMMVHPASGDIYVVTKMESGPAFVYKIAPAFGSEKVQDAKRVGEIAVPAVPNGLITGGEIAPDGRRVLLCDYFAGYELVFPEGSANFDDIWSQKPVAVNIGKRKAGEAAAYTTDGAAIIATSEGKNAPIFRTPAVRRSAQ